MRYVCVPFVPQTPWLNSVDLNSKVFEGSASFVPYYPGQSSVTNSATNNINNHSSFEESFVNTELNNMSSYVDPGEQPHGQSQQTGVRQQVLGGASSSLLRSSGGGNSDNNKRPRHDKMKQAGPRLSTLRHDEVIPQERGARKAPMGRPLRLGSTTEELAQGTRSVAQVAREQERSLLHLNYHEQLHTPYGRQGPGQGSCRAPVGTGLGGGVSGHLNKSVSFLTLPDQSQSQVLGDAVQDRSTDPLSATNSWQGGTPPLGRVALPGRSCGMM